MSRTNKSRTSQWRGGGGHSYVTSGQTFKQFLKAYHNSRLRQGVRQKLKDVLFTDAFDEKEILGKKKEHRFNMWRYT
jgi:hypothetical protein